MSYYNRYRNRKRFDGASGAAGSSGSAAPSIAPSDAIFDLGKNKRVTVRQFRNMNLIDIREYYMDTSTGDMRPGKKGISLTEDLYDELLKHRLNIDEALRRLGSKRPRTKTVRLLSDEEDETTAGQENVKERETFSHTRSEEESPKKKVKPAPPTLLPQEEKKMNDEREANATLVIPGAGKRQEAKQKAKPEPRPEPRLEPKVEPRLEPKVEPRLEPKAEPSVQDEDASDEEFVQNLEDEMNKIDDDVSEEE